MNDIENFDTCTHPLGISLTADLAQVIESGDRVRVVIEGRFTKIEVRDVALMRCDDGHEVPMLHPFLTFKPDWSQDDIELTTTPPWRKAP